jgi:hypothetical protein
VNSPCPVLQWFRVSGIAVALDITLYQLEINANCPKQQERIVELLVKDDSFWRASSAASGAVVPILRSASEKLLTVSQSTCIVAYIDA